MGDEHEHAQEPLPAMAAVAGRPEAAALPGVHAPLAVLALQRAAGNAATSRVLARRIAAEQLPGKPAAEIMADDTYIDNGIKSIEFFGAEQATIHYADNALLTIGLVPEWIADPIEGVDYLSTDHAQVATTTPGTFTYIAHGQVPRRNAPKGLTFDDFLKRMSRPVTFKLDGPSGRILPTQVNSLTAPVLCATLRKAHEEYVKSTDEIAKGMVKALKVLEVALIIASFLPTGGESAAAAGARGAAGGAARAGAAAEQGLLALFKRLLTRGGAEAAAEITVEGVGMSGIEVTATRGGRFIAHYTHIINLAGNPGAGRIAQAAFERAAVAAAKEAGCTTAEVAVHTIVNPKWMTYLESIGYAPELLDTATGFTKVWLKVIKL